MYEKRLFRVVGLLLFAAFARSGVGQTFGVNQPPSSRSANPKQKKGAGAAASTPENGGIGWGSGIETAREASAVDQALQQGDYRSGIASAPRAARSAPSTE